MDTYNFLRAYDRERTEALRPDSRETAENGPLGRMASIDSGWIAVVMLVGGGIFMLFSALKLLSLFSIDGFTIKGGTLETTHHGSVLHKNVDEIVYCFERSKIDIVVIEDLDRFALRRSSRGCGKSISLSSSPRRSNDRSTSSIPFGMSCSPSVRKRNSST